MELGVPADSADCYLLRTRTKGDTFIVEVLHDELYSRHDKFTNLLEYLPCWSVGRLMEIFDICKTCRTDCYRDWVEYTACDDYVEFIIGVFDFWNSTLDFSKLEE